ncbi:MAG: glycoside hydrolase family 16 protein [Bacteroidota bacterium]
MVQVIVFIWVILPTILPILICKSWTITVPSLFTAIKHAFIKIFNKNKWPRKKVGWEICFEDNFDSKTLDLSKWTPQYGVPRTSFEDFDKIIENAPGYPQEFYAVENIECTGNSLKLWSTKETRTHTILPSEVVWMSDDPEIQQALIGKKLTSNYTGAWLSTHNKSWGCVPKKQGYFEVRAKNPNSWGFWTAFWMTPDNHQFPSLPFFPWPPEIDVFEFWTNELRVHRPGVHLKPRQQEINNNKSTSNFAKKITVGNNTGKKFNIYGCEWNEDELIFYFNHIKVFSTKKGSKKIKPPEKIEELLYPMGLILDIRIDQNWVHKAKFPNCLEIDYVRVYKKKA